MRALASQGCTLREIGVVVGVSHETARNVLRRSAPAALASDSRSLRAEPTPWGAARLFPAGVVRLQVHPSTGGSRGSSGEPDSLGL